MTTIKYNNKTPEVITLCEMLFKLGYQIKVSDSFTLEVDAAVKDFQRKHNLIVDGIVGMKTWSKLFELNTGFTSQNDKFLSESDLIDFANNYGLEVAVVKAVNEVESSGKGFLLSGKPKILFEGHIFWSQLEKRGINPADFSNSNTQNVLYRKWTKIYYQGGEKEYERLDEAINISSNPLFKDAAYCSASWGAYQIMGFHAKPLGYANVQEFVDKMYLHEREHLKAFGKFLEVNNIISHLKNKNWAEFARRYNGSGYKLNKYDEKLQRAYVKYS